MRRHRLTDKGIELRRAGGKIVDKVFVRSFGALSPEQLRTFDELLIELLSSPATDREQ